MTGRCPHVSENLLRYAPVPCMDCRGWVLADRTVIGTQEMLRRYPAMSQITAASPRHTMPDYQETAGERVLLGVSLAGRLAGRLLWTMVVLAVFIAVVLALAHAL